MIIRLVGADMSQSVGEISEKIEHVEACVAEDRRGARGTPVR
jgi:hypothetical protein